MVVWWRVKAHLVAKDAARLRSEGELTIPIALESVVRTLHECANDLENPPQDILAAMNNIWERGVRSRASSTKGDQK
jgi:hypothetical protein